MLGELIERRFPWESPVDATGALDVELVVGRLGTMLLAAIPYEVFAETTRRLRDQLGLRMATVSLANAVIGYLPPADELPRGGYEVDESFLFFRLPRHPVPRRKPALLVGSPSSLPSSRAARGEARSSSRRCPAALPATRRNDVRGEFAGNAAGHRRELERASPLAARELSSELGDPADNAGFRRG